MSVTRTGIAIVGAGFSGLGAAIRLLGEGERDFVILERADDVGGVWRDNRYPGCACDVESHLYCFSFAPNPRWSHSYSPQPEIQQYLRDCVERFGLRPHLRLGHTLTSAAWDEGDKAWRIETDKGAFLAEIFVAALGALAEPKWPDVPGLDEFAGRAVHSARWPQDLDVRGKRVAVVGTGASAAQIVSAIQPEVAQLVLMQRTPAWVMPRVDRTFTEQEKARFARSKVSLFTERAKIYAKRELLAVGFFHPRLSFIGEGIAKKWLEKNIGNSQLRARLTPSYKLGCKRVVVSNDFYAALNEPNATVTSGLQRVEETGVVDEEGVLHPVDVIVLATGFLATEWPWAQHAFGRRHSLADTWRGSPRGYMGTTVSGFPNFFVIPGPNTGLGHTSVLVMAEAQIEHMLACLRAMKAKKARVIEPRIEAQTRFSDEMDRRMRGTVWTVGGCVSWYLDHTGRNSTLWPAYTPEFRRRAAALIVDDYVFDADPVVGVADRAEVAAARGLRALPPFVQRVLSGGAVVIDGQTLAPDVALVLRAQQVVGGDGLTLDSALEARARLRRSAMLHEGTRLDVTVEHFEVAGLRARRYRAASECGAITLYFHGGGMVVGDLDTHDSVARRLCRDANVQVLSVQYRLAPEHRFPAGVDDALSAFAWVQAHARGLGGDGRVVVAGDSAGGNLAAVVAQSVRGDAGPDLQLLLYPTLDRVTPYRSLELFDKGFMLTRADIEWFMGCYTGDDRALDADVRISPGLAADLTGVAPALVYTAGFDPLRDEGERYAARLAEAGALVDQRRFPGVVHGFMQMGAVSRSSEAAIEHVTRALARALRGAS